MNETGYTICQCGQELVKGCEARGKDSSHVSISICCPRGCHPVGTFHTHPGGTREPSDADIAETKRVGLKHLCISVPEKGLTRCFDVE